jgi:hypothetical protein
MNYNTRPEFHHDSEFILATIRKRFVALLIDGLVLIIIYFCILILFSLLNMNISEINVHSIFDVEIKMNNAHSFLITFLKFLFGLLPTLYFAQDKGTFFVP